MPKFTVTTGAKVKHEVEADYYKHESDFINFYTHQDGDQIFSIAAGRVNTIELEKDKK